MRIGDYEFPDSCPDNCPDLHYMETFDQGNNCTRCPIFNCREIPYNGGKVSMLRPEQYPEELAKAWYEWFKKNKVF
jgi:hypothetical protein